MDTSDTIIALSTPLGYSGIAAIRLSGPQCFALAQSMFKRSDIRPRFAYHGSYYVQSGAILDDVVFIFFSENASYTKESMLEIFCHGNPLIVQQLIRDGIARGCRQAEPGEFTRRAFMNGAIDLCQAEAVETVIHAQSLQALRVAQQQLGGSLSQKVNAFCQQLTDQIAWVEAYLDFPEDDLPEEDRRRFEAQLETLHASLVELIDAHAAYHPVFQGIRTVIAGIPNAGKSTLFNRLLGHSRAIVSDVPGTTRDYLSESYRLEPYTLELVDTAGLRESPSPLECIGMQRTREQLQQADVILAVVDGSIPPATEWDAALFPPNKTLVLLNKADLGILPSVRDAFAAYTAHPIVLKDPACLPQLQQWLRLFLEQRYRDVSQVKFMVTERHVEAFQQARLAIERSQSLLQQHAYDDCLAAELRAALTALERVVGRVDYECVLDALFSKFCIGK